MAARTRPAARQPSHAFRAALAAWLSVSGCIVALALFPDLLAVIVFACWPAGATYFAAAGSRSAYITNMAVAPFAAGITCAIWLAATDTDARAIAIAIGAFVTLVLITLVGTLAAYGLRRWLDRRDAWS